VRGRDVRFAEARMAEFLREPTVLIDANRAPRELAAGLAAAMRELACDCVVFADVGGDALAAGGEPGLASPLCDAVLLAAAAQMHEAPVLGAVIGPGCDGELTVAEVRARVDAIEAVGALVGFSSFNNAELERVEAAAKLVPTEASAMVVRAARGETGEVMIREGRRTVVLEPMAGQLILFDPVLAVARGAAPLAAAVVAARNLEHANDLLHERGVRTELDYEREVAPRKGDPPAGSTARTG
jgi:hypothetical protein